VAYVVKIEDWSDAIGTISTQTTYSMPNNVPPQGFTPANPADFAARLEQYRVKEGPPPVETYAMPYHAIYVVRLGDQYFWNDITPTFNGNNVFTVWIPSNANH
jgi:hypothetical protein